jgi:hypothetical protein
MIATSKTAISANHKPIITQTMAKHIPHTSVVVADFHYLAREPDTAIIARFNFYCANFKKKPFPKSAIVNAYRIERKPLLVTIYLLDATDPLNHKTKATFSFEPPPNFSRSFIST